MCDEDFCPIDYNDIPEDDDFIESDDFIEQTQVIVPPKGQCKSCGVKCGISYDLCFKCKFKDTKPIKRVSAVDGSKDIETKSIDEVKVVENACQKCNKAVKGDYKLCWTCKTDALTGSCSKCGNKCDSKYPTCFKCKDNLSTSIQMNKCIKCGKNCKPPFVQCYTCNRS